MRRGRPLAANPAKVRAWQDRSRDARRLYPDERDVQSQVFRRDQWTCLLKGTGICGPCNGPLTFHHRRKASAGGAYTVENGATLCLGHNQAVEISPLFAREQRPDLVVREGDPEWEALGVRAARHG